ncbi:hypothetical protein H8E52_08735 [bacterium]|nr:hypothetical protein [bacterium]
MKNSEGIVPVQEVMAALGRPEWNPELPDWVLAWSEADLNLPWPPEGFD